MKLIQGMYEECTQGDYATSACPEVAIEQEKFCEYLKDKLGSDFNYPELEEFINSISAKSEKWGFRNGLNCMRLLEKELDDNWEEIQWRDK